MIIFLSSANASIRWRTSGISSLSWLISWLKSLKTMMNYLHFNNFALAMLLTFIHHKIHEDTLLTMEMPQRNVSVIDTKMCEYSTRFFAPQLALFISIQFTFFGNNRMFFLTFYVFRLSHLYREVIYFILRTDGGGISTGCTWAKFGSCKLRRKRWKTWLHECCSHQWTAVKEWESVHL